jgi:arsenate reductase (glutaredoxin)
MITYWHNPRCSKSRAGLHLLQERGAEVSLRLYLQERPSLDEITALQRALGGAVIDMMRCGEKVFKSMGLSKTSPEADLLAAMVQEPILIERPIAVKQRKAVIGRPTEVLEAVL